MFNCESNNYIKTFLYSSNMGSILIMSEKKNVVFRYNKPENYNLVYVNGVYGGITPKGEIFCNFFYEHGVMPKEQIFEITEDGKMGQEVKGDEEQLIIDRDLKAGLIFKPADAELIAKWILDNVGKLRGVKK